MPANIPVVLCTERIEKYQACTAESEQEVTSIAELEMDSKSKAGQWLTNI